MGTKRGDGQVGNLEGQDRQRSRGRLSRVFFGAADRSLCGRALDVVSLTRFYLSLSLSDKNDTFDASV